MAGKPGKLAYFVRLMLFWAGLVGPMWIGDENLLFFLLAFIGLFLLCYQGTRAARMVVGTVFYLLLSGMGMLLDMAFNFLPASIWDWSELIISVVKVLAAALVYLRWHRTKGLQSRHGLRVEDGFGVFPKEEQGFPDLIARKTIPCQKGQLQSTVAF